MRAIKYLGTLPIKNPDKTIAGAWSRLRDVATAIPYTLSDDLHAQVSAVVEETDGLIDYLAKEGFKKMSRDELVMDVQASHIMFSAKGKAFIAKKQGPTNNIHELADWFRDNYRFDIKRDPIPGWTTQLAGLKAEKNEHMMLKKYHEFMQRTEDFREGLSESVSAFDAEVDRQIDEARASR